MTGRLGVGVESAEQVRRRGGVLAVVEFGVALAQSRRVCEPAGHYESSVVGILNTLEEVKAGALSVAILLAAEDAVVQNF